MKTLKVVLVATIVAFALVSVAKADGFQPKPKPIHVISITLEKAMQIPGLVAAMCEQVTLGDLIGGSQSILVVQVTYNGTVYRISGTQGQWLRFFQLKIHPTFNNNEPVFGIG